MAFNKVLTFVVICFCTEVVKSNENKRQIQEKVQQPTMLFLIFRHGARAPIKLIPNETYNSIWEEIGLGELTNLGKRQQVENGEIIRKEYNRFIGPYYNFSQFYIQSTTINRAVMSGQAFTTGLFPPLGNQEWENSCLGRKWQPIPVFTIFPASSIKDVLPTGAVIFKLFGQAISDPDIKQRNKEVLEAIAKALAVPKSDYFMYADALIGMIYEKVELPSELKNYEEKIFALLDNIFNYVMETYYPSLASGLLNDMVQKIELYKAKNSTIRTYVYSLHDTHVAAFMAAVYAYVGEPEFCGTAYLELYGPDEKSDSDYIIIRYRRNLKAESKAVYIKNCGYSCPYDKFLELVKEVNKLNNNLQF